jgi:hypothetical protein
MSVGEHISKREGDSTVWKSCTFDFSHEVLTEIINYLLTNAGWAVEGQPGVLWVVIAVCDILIPSEMDGLVIFVVLNFWALWSALSFTWCAINMSIEAHDSVASDSIENINSYIIVAIVAAMAAVMASVIMIVVDMHGCCIGFNVHRGLWSVCLDMLIAAVWVVYTARLTV